MGKQTEKIALGKDLEAWMGKMKEHFHEFTSEDRLLYGEYQVDEYQYRSEGEQYYFYLSDTSGEKRRVNLAECAVGKIIFEDGIYYYEAEFHQIHEPAQKYIPAVMIAIGVLLLVSIKLGWIGFIGMLILGASLGSFVFNDRVHESNFGRNKLSSVLKQIGMFADHDLIS